jgi:tetratricopeptide (TPR) repeat protein/tRNA A-37 threonylcarbamoyl transferase component Bud32
MIGQTVSHYRILGKLGEGAMSAVYMAEDMLLGRRVAFKVLSAKPHARNFRARMLREARAISSVKHKHIATIYEYGETPEGQPYIVMELVDGPTLGELIRDGALTIERAVEIIADVAEGLTEAHRRGIIHRDIKPSNVAIDDHGEVKILDFGIAKHLKGDEPVEGSQNAQAALTTQTGEGTWVGTPLYSSPEQALGMKVDARSDLFSLGSLLYECVAGRPAFDGDNALAVRAKVVRNDPPPPSQFNPDIPPSLDHITLKALSKNVEDRYQKAEDFRVDLRAAREHLLTSPARRPTPAPPPPAKLDRSLSTTVINMLRKPRHLAAVFLSTLVLGLVIWQVPRFLRAPAGEINAVAKPWMVKGTDALGDGTFYKARKMFEEAVRLDDEYALAHARLAESLTELGYPDRANAEIARANALVLDGKDRLMPEDTLYLKAVNAIITRDYAGAVKNYDEIFASASREEKARVLVDLGRAYEKGGEAAKALESYTRAASSSKDNAAAFLRSGVIYARQQDYARAGEAFDEAARIYQAQSNTEGWAEVLLQRAVLLRSKGDFAGARSELEGALKVAHGTGNSYQEVRSLLQLSNLLSSMHQADEAKGRATEAINLARVESIYDLAVQGLIDLGNAFLAERNAPAAEDYFKQALELSRANAMRGNEARALLTLGSLYVQQDDADRGLLYVTQALPYYEQNGLQGQAMQAQALIGQAENHKGEYVAALQSFERALQIAGQLGNKSQTALAHKGAATSLIYQGRYTEALSHLEQSYSIYSAQGAERDAGYSLVSRADVMWRLGRYDEARAALGQASSLAEQPSGNLKQLWLRIYLAEAAMNLSERRFGDAAAASRKAIAEDDSKTKHAATEATYLMGLARSLSGATGEGLHICEDALKMATQTANPRLMSEAQLALAEARLEAGDAPGAAGVAEGAQRFFAQLGRTEAEWRAWLTSARARLRSGDPRTSRAAAERAGALLSSLRQLWGDEAFEGYLKRPDVQTYRQQLLETSTAAARRQ